MKKILDLGIDIGSQHHAWWAQDAESVILGEGEIANNHEGIDLLLAQVKEWQLAGYEVWVAAEGVGGYASPLDVELCKADCRYVNVSPESLANYRKSFQSPPDKTDQNDARLLADWLRFQRDHNPIRTTEPFDEYFAALKNLVHAAQHTTHEKVAHQNQLVSQVRTYWPELVEKGRYFSTTDAVGLLMLLSSHPTPAAVAQAGVESIAALLKEARHPKSHALAERLVSEAQTIAQRQGANDSLGQFVQVLARHVLHLLRLGKEWEKQMEERLRDHPFGAWMLGQQGIGPKTAGAFLGETGELGKYASDASLARYAGVAPTRTQSGARTDYHRDRHQHNHRLKRAIILMAQSRAQHHDESRQFRDRRKKDKNYWRSLRQLARYMIRMLWKTWKKFEDNLWIEQPVS